MTTLALAPGLTLSRHDRSRFLVLIASGDIDMRSAPLLRRELAVATATEREVVLDLTDVCFFGAAAYEAVLSVSLRDNEILSVVAPNPMIRRTFDILGCPEWLYVHAGSSTAA